MIRIVKLSLFICVFISSLISSAQDTFTNPLLPSGADPWSFYKDGYYFYTHTSGKNISIWKTKSIADLKTAEHKVIWVPPSTGPDSKELWAPEVQFIQGKWYVYFAADDGKNENHRLFVLENTSSDPFEGSWIMKGKLADTSDKWAIDGSVFEHHNKLYLIWSGWEGDVNGRQDIYIAKMKNPWQIEGSRIRISKPDYEWEKTGDPDVNEGPEVLIHDKNIFLTYSASGCWTDEYALGMLTASINSNLLDPHSWKKSPKPVFVKSVADSVFAPGHNSFFKSPDGKEDWILYHANNKPNLGCEKQRSPRAQKIKWKADGTPYFGTPVAESRRLPVPSNAKIK